MTKTIAVIAGSLRKGSINVRLMKALETLAGDRLRFRVLSIGDLPHYNEDLWDNPPQSLLALKDTLSDVDGVLAITPEYNRSYPGVIKNALDWATRPYGDNSWAGKPAAVTGTSPGAIGAAMGQAKLKADMLACSMIVMNAPEAYLQWKDSAFAADGRVTDEATEKFLAGFVDAFVDWVEKHG